MSEKNNLEDKLDELIELVADSAMVGSKQGHGLSDLKESIGRL